EGLAEIIEKENRSLPKEISGGATLEKLESQPGLRVISRVTLPVDASEVTINKHPDIADFACSDKVGRWMLDHGVTWVSRFKDKNNTIIMHQEVKLEDCKDRKS